MTKIMQSSFMGVGLGPNANGVFVIGGTNDILYGGDMSGDVAGNGLALASATAGKQFGLALYADDAGAELGTGWVSSLFGSFMLTIAVTPSCNLSAFGTTGQLHIDASVSTIGNLGGLYGVCETSGAGVTVTGNMCGVLAGITLASGDTLASGYYACGILVGGAINGTTTGKTVAMFVQNPGSTEQFDAAFAFGQDSQMAGVVTAAAVGGSQSHKLKVYAGGTLFYIPLHTA